MKLEVDPTKGRAAIPSRATKGFSVLEVLVIVLVVAITTFVAVPNLGLNGDANKEARERQAAQSIVSVYQSGFAAGVAWNASTRSAKIDAVISGQAATDGAFSGKFFAAPGGVEKVKAGAFKYIGCDANGDLYYDSTGNQPSFEGKAGGSSP